MTNCVFTADTLENGLGFARFTTHATLALPGRGYVKEDVLEIRAIVRVDAVANMAAPPPNAHIIAGTVPDLLRSTPTMHQLPARPIFWLYLNHVARLC